MTSDEDEVLVSLAEEVAWLWLIGCVIFFLLLRLFFLGICDLCLKQKKFSISCLNLTWLNPAG